MPNEPLQTILGKELLAILKKDNAKPNVFYVWRKQLQALREQSESSLPKGVDRILQSLLLEIKEPFALLTEEQRRLLQDPEYPLEEEEVFAPFRMLIERLRSNASSVDVSVVKDILNALLQKYEEYVTQLRHARQTKDLDRLRDLLTASSQLLVETLEDEPISHRREPLLYDISTGLAYQLMSIKEDGKKDRTYSHGDHDVKKIDEVHVKSLHAQSPKAPLQPGIENRLYHFSVLFHQEPCLAPVRPLKIRSTITSKDRDVFLLSVDENEPVENLRKLVLSSQYKNQNQWPVIIRKGQQYFIYGHFEDSQWQIKAVSAPVFAASKLFFREKKNKQYHVFADDIEPSIYEEIARVKGHSFYRSSQVDRCAQASLTVGDTMLVNWLQVEPHFEWLKTQLSSVSIIIHHESREFKMEPKNTYVFFVQKNPPQLHYYNDEGKEQVIEWQVVPQLASLGDTDNTPLIEATLRAYYQAELLSQKRFEKAFPILLKQCTTTSDKMTLNELYKSYQGFLSDLEDCENYLTDLAFLLERGKTQTLKKETLEALIAGRWTEVTAIYSILENYPELAEGKTLAEWFDIYQSLTLIQSWYPEVAIADLSEHISQLWQHIDKENFAQHVLMSFLMLTKDGKSDNYRVAVERKDEKLSFRLLGIDNDEIGSESISLAGGYPSSLLRSLLLCFPLMKTERVPVSVRERLLKQSSELFLRGWLRALTQEEHVHQQWNAEAPTFFSTKPLAVSPYPPARDLSTLLCQLKQMHQFLSEYPECTLEELFLALEPVVARFYKKITQEFQEEPLNSYELIKQRNLEVELKDLWNKTQLPGNRTIEQALSVYENPHKLYLFTGEALEPEHFVGKTIVLKQTGEGIDAYLMEENQIKVIPLALTAAERHLLPFPNLPGQFEVFEYVVELEDPLEKGALIDKIALACGYTIVMDWEAFRVAEAETDQLSPAEAKVYQQLLSITPLCVSQWVTDLDLSGYAAMDNEGLAAILERFPQVKTLSLRGCTRLDGATLFNVLHHALPELESLCLDENPAFVYLEPTLGSLLPKLKQLSAQFCPQLEQINTTLLPQLELLFVRGSTALELCILYKKHAFVANFSQAAQVAATQQAWKQAQDYLENFEALLPFLTPKESHTAGLWLHQFYLRQVMPLKSNAFTATPVEGDLLMAGTGENTQYFYCPNQPPVKGGWEELKAQMAELRTRVFFWRAKPGRPQALELIETMNPGLPQHTRHFLERPSGDVVALDLAQPFLSLPQSYSETQMRTLLSLDKKEPSNLLQETANQLILSNPTASQELIHLEPLVLSLAGSRLPIMVCSIPHRVREELKEEKQVDHRQMVQAALSTVVEQAEKQQRSFEFMLQMPGGSWVLFLIDWERRIITDAKEDELPIYFYDPLDQFGCKEWFSQRWAMPGKDGTTEVVLYTGEKPECRVDILQPVQCGVLLLPNMTVKEIGQVLISKPLFMKKDVVLVLTQDNRLHYLYLLKGQWQCLHVLLEKEDIESVRALLNQSVLDKRESALNEGELALNEGKMRILPDPQFLSVMSILAEEGTWYRCFFDGGKPVVAEAPVFLKTTELMRLEEIKEEWKAAHSAPLDYQLFYLPKLKRWHFWGYTGGKDFISMEPKRDNRLRELARVLSDWEKTQSEKQEWTSWKEIRWGKRMYQRVLASILDDLYHIPVPKLAKKESDPAAYRLCWMSSELELEKKELRVKIEGNSLQYTVIAPSGETQTGFIDEEELGCHFKEYRTLEQLQTLLSDILKITAKRGHTHLLPCWIKAHEYPLIKQSEAWRSAVWVAEASQRFLLENGRTLGGLTEDFGSIDVVQSAELQQRVIETNQSTPKNKPQVKGIQIRQAEKNAASLRERRQTGYTDEELFVILAKEEPLTWKAVMMGHASSQKERAMAARLLWLHQAEYYRLQAIEAFLSACLSEKTRLSKKSQGLKWIYDRSCLYRQQLSENAYLNAVWQESGRSSQEQFRDIEKLLIELSDFLLQQVYLVQLNRYDSSGKRIGTALLDSNEEGEPLREIQGSSGVSRRWFLDKKWLRDKQIKFALKLSWSQAACERAQRTWQAWVEKDRVMPADLPRGLRLSAQEPWPPLEQQSVMGVKLIGAIREQKDWAIPGLVRCCYEWLSGNRRELLNVIQIQANNGDGLFHYLLRAGEWRLASALLKSREEGILEEVARPNKAGLTAMGISDPTTGSNTWLHFVLLSAKDHWLCRNGNVAEYWIDIAQTLIECGANLNLYNQSNETLHGLSLAPDMPPTLRKKAQKAWFYRELAKITTGKIGMSPKPVRQASQHEIVPWQEGGAMGQATRVVSQDSGFQSVEEKDAGYAYAEELAVMYLEVETRWLAQSELAVRLSGEMTLWQKLKWIFSRDKPRLPPRGGYRLCWMKEDREPQENELHVKIEVNRLHYAVIAPSGKVEKSYISTRDIDREFEDAVTLDELKHFLPSILKITAERVHTIKGVSVQAEADQDHLLEVKKQLSNHLIEVLYALEINNGHALKTCLESFLVKQHWPRNLYQNLGKEGKRAIIIQKEHREAARKLFYREQLEQILTKSTTVAPLMIIPRPGESLQGTKGGADRSDVAQEDTLSGCDLLVSEIEPRPEILGSLPIQSSSAYVRYKQSLFYLDIQRRICHNILMTKEKLNQLDALLKPTNRARELLHGELRQIGNIIENPTLDVNKQTANSVLERTSLLEKKQTRGLKKSAKKKNVLSALPSIKKIDKQSKKLFNNQGIFNHVLATYLPKGSAVGKITDEGDSFFDALAQALNQVDSTRSHTVKSLRKLCYYFYLENKNLVDEWNQQNPREGDDDYDRVRDPAPTCKRLGKKLIEGRPWVEGRILCHQLPLDSFYVIDVIEDSATKQPIRTYYLTNADGYRPITVEEAQSLGNIPTLVIEPQSLRYQPVLRCDVSNEASQNEPKLTARQNTSYPDVLFSPAKVFKPMAKAYEEQKSSFLSLSEDGALRPDEVANYCTEQQITGFKAIKTDGNCFFRSMLATLGKDEKQHLTLRQDVVKFMRESIRKDPNQFPEGTFVITRQGVEEPVTMEEYLIYMEQANNYAEGVIIKFTAEFLQCQIDMIQLTRGANNQPETNSWRFTPFPALNAAGRTVLVLRVNDNHYHAAGCPLSPSNELNSPDNRTEILDETASVSHNGPAIVLEEEVQNQEELSGSPYNDYDYLEETDYDSGRRPFGLGSTR